MPFTPLEQEPEITPRQGFTPTPTPTPAPKPPITPPPAQVAPQPKPSGPLARVRQLIRPFEAQAYSAAAGEE